MQTDANENCLSAQAKKSSFEHSTVTPSLFGESSLTTAESKESVVPRSETKARIIRASLSDRQTQSLITAGLVKGIIPLSIRKGLGPQIPAIASWLRDGGNATTEPKAG